MILIIRFDNFLSFPSIIFRDFFFLFAPFQLSVVKINFIESLTRYVVVGGITGMRRGADIPSNGRSDRLDGKTLL